MKINAIVHALEEYAPRTLQESWDNSGLQIGLPAEADGEVTGVLLCVDVNEAVIAEAIARGFNMVVSHHPLFFKGVKQFTGNSVQQRAAMAAIRGGVAVYSAHTSLDSTRGGVSYAMARALGATVERALSPADRPLVRLTVICPRTAASDVELVLFDNDATDSLAISADRAETHMSADDPVPAFDISHTPMTRVETVVSPDRVSLLMAQLGSMPRADELKIDTTSLDNVDPMLGLGVLATLPAPIDMGALAEKIKEVFGTPCIRANAAYDPERTVTRLALCGGAGGEFIARASASGAQVYITADVRYHDFCDNPTGMAIFDIGHFESELCATEIFMNVISQKFPNFAVEYSKTDINPVKYL